MWTAIQGILNHGFAGRWRLGGLLPAVNEDEAVTKGQLQNFDGPINIDFTDTLGFVSDQVDYYGDPTLGSTLQGDFIGFKYEDLAEDEIGYAGMFDGVIDVPSVPAQLPFKGHVSNFGNTDLGVFLSSRQGIIDTTPLGGAETYLITPLRIVANGETVEVGGAVTADGSDYTFSFSKESAAGLAELELNSSIEGFNFRSDYADEDTFVTFKDNDADELLGLRGNSITSANLASKDFADDAAAEAGDVPLNGLYHTSGVVKIRLT